MPTTNSHDHSRWAAAICAALAAAFAACSAADHGDASARFCAGLAAGFASLAAALNAAGGMINNRPDKPKR